MAALFYKKNCTMISKATIKKWNDYFKSLSTAEKRVAIARDVIRAIKSKKYIPARMTYVSLDVNGEIEQGEDFFELDIQTHFDAIKHCNVCALGSCMMSLIKYENNVTFEEIGQAESILRRLEKYFSLKQLFYIESVFEGWSGDKKDGHAISRGFEPKTHDKALVNDAKNDGAYHYCGEFRLIEIMQNIIRNAGTFDPLDYTAKQKKRRR